jgi:hypothetical protein
MSTIRAPTALNVAGEVEKQPDSTGNCLREVLLVYPVADNHLCRNTLCSQITPSRENMQISSYFFHVTAQLVFSNVIYVL